MPDLIPATFFSIPRRRSLRSASSWSDGDGGRGADDARLIYLGVGDAATVVTADLAAAAVYKSSGAIVHEGVPPSCSWPSG